jgi:aldehyde:ferredoxin oxidoreductase
MLGGCMGQTLEVDLTTGATTPVPLDEDLARDDVGGYGLGARLLYERIKPRIDPLGPKNLLGFFTGPLTGSPSIEGNRFVVVCKSPLTGGWGNANCGGTFGPGVGRVVPPRLLGNPPQTDGNVRGVTVDLETHVRESCEANGWDHTTGVPHKERVERLGLDVLARDLHVAV